MNVVEALALLSHEQEAERDRALLVLAADKRSAATAIVNALKRPAPPAQFSRMVLLLAAFEARDAVVALLELLDRGTLGFDERAVVARAMGELVDERHRSDPRLRRHALALSRDLMAPTRASIIPALAALGDDAAIDALRMLAVTDTDAEVKRRASAALSMALAARPTPAPTPLTTSTAAQASSLASTASAASTASMRASSSGTASSPALPEGAVAVDFAALLQASTSPPPVSSTATSVGVPEGGLELDLEAMVRAQQRSSSSSSSSSTSPAPPPLSPAQQRIARLRDPRWTERARAVEDVVAAGAEMVPLLIEHLGHDAPARMGICLALARLQAPEAASALLMVATSEAQTSDDRDLQAVALKALANSLTGNEQGVSAPLLPLLKSPDPFVRSGAVVCLGRLADRVGARAATLVLATDPHDEVRKAAAVALSEAAREDDVDLVPAWLGALQAVPRPSVEGQEALLVALARVDLGRVEGAVGDVNAPWRVRARHRVRPLVFGMTSSVRKQAITILDRCYADDDPPPAWVVADVLDRLHDTSADVRVVAASFVARFLEPGFTGAVARLEDALELDERTLSLLCLEALRRHDTPLAKAALEAAAASDPDDQVRARAKALLIDFAPRSAEWARAVVSSSEPSAFAATGSPSVATRTTDPVSSSTSAAPAAAAAPAASAAPRRVRAATGSGDVVEARDAPTSKAEGAPPTGSSGSGG